MMTMTARHCSSSRPRSMIMSFASLAAILVVQLSLLASTVPPLLAFVVPVQHHQQQQTPPRSCSSSLIVLKARKVKRSGLLNDLAEAGGVVSKSTTPRSRRSSSSAATKKKKSGSSKSSSSAPPEGIAPGLADWVSKQQQSSDDNSSADIVVDDNDDDNIVTSTATKEIKKGKKDKRSKNNKKSEQQQVQDSILNERVDSLLDQLDNALEEKGNLGGILSIVGQLFDVTPERSSSSSSSSPSRLKSLLASKPGRTGGQGARPQYNFRLAWVGSDEALCHIGTGLHKVPLARMQEVFLCCLGRNRIEFLEVISITGPFPNIRNTLQGETKIMKGGGISDGNSNMEKLRIDVDSMTDGTGKELLPPGEKSRIVDLDVYFSDERAIVAVVPPSEDDDDTDPLRMDGQNVLVFVREDEMDDKLDSLRVS
mmetsp:Transcript_1698/g.3864  ORF Transcript_1698/g.3864 Transcript_1698/m.3864 type:complete len:425 (-) Transcript_1698:234-1508(-)